MNENRNNDNIIKSNNDFLRSLNRDYNELGYNDIVDATDIGLVHDSIDYFQSDNYLQSPIRNQNNMIESHASYLQSPINMIKHPQSPFNINKQATNYPYINTSEDELYPEDYDPEQSMTVGTMFYPINNDNNNQVDLMSVTETTNQNENPNTQNIFANIDNNLNYPKNNIINKTPEKVREIMKKEDSTYKNYLGSSAQTASAKKNLFNIDDQNRCSRG